MSTPESFVSRWSRLKSEAGGRTVSEPAGLSLEPDAVEAKPVGADAAKAAPTETNEPDPPVFHPASLPPIESISASTDIRSFLQSDVPADLTRAALRRAWVADPTIRDFIGIAKNQWDFNDPTAIPGFGPLTAADDVPGLLARVMSTAVLGVVEHHLGHLGRGQGVDREAGGVRGPGDDVDLLALQLADDGLDAAAAHADAGADRVDRAVRRVCSLLAY